MEKNLSAGIVLAFVEVDGNRQNRFLYRGLLRGETDSAYNRRNRTDMLDE